MAKILLVEDDNNLREIYEARLQAEGYQIVSANDGESALVVAKSEKPDLIISDVMMPKISGFEMLDILRNTEGLKDVKVIMLTALGQADDQARANQLGADKYLVKSQVTLEDIVKVSHDLLDGDGDAAAAAPEDAKSAEEAPAEPAPVPAEPAQNIPVASAPADNTQSSAQEESAVEKQIQDFVATAPTDPPAAADADANQTADDQVMSDAVDDLVANTEGDKPAPASTEAAPVAPPAEEEAPTGDIEHNSEGGRKVIKPLDSEPKPDLDALLALEEARETSAAPAEPVVGGEDKPAGAPTPAPSEQAEKVKEDDKPVDPNSIAL